MKNLIALAALPMMAAPAMAGPYVNVESNSGFLGSDYGGTAIEAHVGYEGALSDTVSAYAQVGPAFVLPEGGNSETEISGKVGINVAATDNLGFYGEYAAITTPGDLASNVKVGVKYAF